MSKKRGLADPIRLKPFDCRGRAVASARHRNIYSHRARRRFHAARHLLAAWFAPMILKNPLAHRESGNKIRSEASTIVTPGKRKKPTFDPQVFLAYIGRGRKIVSYPKGATVFAQGDSCDAVFYIQSGKVKLTVVSATGKEATIAILSEGDFFGEDSLARHRLRLATVTALTDCNLMRIDKNAMLRVLHGQHTFSDLFTEHLLSRNIRYQEDLIDQLFNSSEKRLARILLIFAGFGKDGIREKTEIPKVSQETLAEMVGTTRPRVNAFMNKFRKLGFIEYNGGLEVHSSLLNVVLLE